MDASSIVISREESSSATVPRARAEAAQPWREWLRRIPENARGAMAAAALTFWVVAIHGYHPFAEDGGLYVSGVLKVLHPSLYPAWPGFVTALFRFSLFTHLVAGLIRWSGLSVAVVLLSLYVVTIWATLFAGWLIAHRCYPTNLACYGAVSLLALWFTLPIAGTSLLLMDPYVTGRSVSTPCGLFAIVGALELLSRFRRTRQVAWRPACATLAALSLAAMVHPLMAGYAAACVALILCSGFTTRALRVGALSVLCLCGIALAALLYGHASAQSAEYARVAQTRTYWFLSNWRWFEVAGLAAPLIVLDALRRRRREHASNAAHVLTRMAIAAGACSLTIAVLFARIHSSSYVVARFQPLRIYQTIYIVMILAVGAFLAQEVLRRSFWRWAGAFLLLGGIMFFIQLGTFPNSAHLELPWIAGRNQWKQAFEWIRTHTAADAAFALDANYINAPGEDSQNFRAIAERSALPDYSKDGGIASIAPDLAGQWTAALRADAGLDRESDAERLRKLQSLAVDWVVLTRNARTQFSCPYANEAVKICRLPVKTTDRR